MKPLGYMPGPPDEWLHGRDTAQVLADGRGVSPVVVIAVADWDAIVAALGARQVPPAEWRCHSWCQGVR